MTLPPSDKARILAARLGDAEAWSALLPGGGRLVPVPRVRSDRSGGRCPRGVVRLHRRFGALASREQFRAFLYGLTRRVVAEHRRRQWWQRFSPWPTRPLPEPRPDPERRCSLGEVAGQIDEILDRM